MFFIRNHIIQARNAYDLLHRVRMVWPIEVLMVSDVVSAILAISHDQCRYHPH